LRLNGISDPDDLELDEALYYMHEILSIKEKEYRELERIRNR
jgi:hypothetical protein